MAEEWRPVVGYNGVYEVSSAGRFRRAGGEIVPVRNKDLDYSSVTLVISMRRRTHLVHHLVAEAFIGPRPLGYDTRHLNDVKHDNRAANLAYGTRSENQLDAVRNGTHKTGHGPSHRERERAQECPRDIEAEFTGTLLSLARASKLRDEVNAQIEAVDAEIRQLVQAGGEEGLTGIQMAEATGLSTQRISQIKRGGRK